MDQELKNEINIMMVNMKNEIQKEINLLDDRLFKIEKIIGIKKEHQIKPCGRCGRTGKYFYGTMCEPPVDNCYICKGKGFI
jgi:hypothetical protein